MRSDIEEAVLRKIKPSPDRDREIHTVMKALCQRVREVTHARGWSIEPILVGSIAKETHLSDPDIDVFIPFPPTTDRQKLKHEGLAIGHAVLPHGKEKYAEHPYVSGIFDGYEADVVPCYNIAEPSTLLSAVDRTPFHTEYVKAHLKPDLRDEVRLLKQFLKGIEVYGADERVKGFSGYLTELLILHFNGFKPLIQAATHWQSGYTIILHTIMDQVERQYLTDVEDEGAPPQKSTLKTLQKRLKAKFSNDILILIDPVDLNRNVASAVSSASLARFIHACKRYGTEPKLTFFLPNPPEPASESHLIEMLDTRGTKVIAVSFQKPDVIEDILFSQLRKAVKRLRKRLATEGFEPVNAEYYVDSETDRVYFLFELLLAELPALKPHFGPPIWHKNARHFLKKWTDGKASHLGAPYLEDERWRVDIVRKYTTGTSVLKEALLSAKLGKYIEERVQQEFRIIDDHHDLARLAPLFLTRFIDRKFPWEY